MADWWTRQGYTYPTATSGGLQPPMQPFPGGGRYSNPDQGSTQQLPDGSTIITRGMDGRTFRIPPGGSISDAVEYGPRAATFAGGGPLSRLSANTTDPNATDPNATTVPPPATPPTDNYPTPGSIPGVGTSPTGPPTLNIHDPTSVAAWVQYYSTQPGANPSLARDPNYWIQKILSGELGTDQNYIIGKFMTPEGAPAGGGGFTFNPDDPSYQFRLNEGLKGVSSRAAAVGNLLTGGTLKALTNYAQNAASQEYANQFGRYYSLADLGLRATTAGGGGSGTTIGPGGTATPGATTSSYIAPGVDKVQAPNAYTVSGLTTAPLYQPPTAPTTYQPRFPPRY